MTKILDGNSEKSFLECEKKSRDALRKARETYLIETLEPKGIKKREEIYLMFNPLVPYVLYSILLFCRY